MALDKNGIAKRIAQELQNGWYVNLGIGIPGADDLLDARISAAASMSLFVATEYLLMIFYL